MPLLFVCIPRVAIADVIGTTRVYNGRPLFADNGTRDAGDVGLENRAFDAPLNVNLIPDSSLNPIREALVAVSLNPSAWLITNRALLAKIPTYSARHRP